MTDDLKSNVKLFEDNIPIAKDLTHDLSLISKWAFKWKMLFNPEPTKPTQEVIFSRKKGDSAHPNIFLITCQ